MLYKSFDCIINVENQDSRGYWERELKWSRYVNIFRSIVSFFFSLSRKTFTWEIIHLKVKETLLNSLTSDVWCFAYVVGIWIIIAYFSKFLFAILLDIFNLIFTQWNASTEMRNQNHRAAFWGVCSKLFVSDYWGLLLCSKYTS